MNKTNITVLLFTHNNNFHGASLALNSLINQTKNPEEIIVMDNSSDNNFYKYKEYTNNEKIKIIYIHNQEKAELASIISRQKALKLVKKKYIVLTEDDGLYVKNFIEELYEGFESGAELICYKILPNENFSDVEWKFVDEGKFCTIYSLLDYGDAKKTIRANLIFNSFAFSKASYEKSSGWGTDFFYSKQFFFYNHDGENNLANSIGSYLSAKKIIYLPSAIMFHSDREKRMNNKFFLFRFSLFGIMKGNKYIEDNFINKNFSKSQKYILKFIYVIKIAVSRLLIFVVSIFFGSKSWKSWLYRSAIYYYHFKLTKLYYFSNDDLQKFFKNYRNSDWKTFNFNNLKPIKLGFFKPLI